MLADFVSVVAAASLWRTPAFAEGTRGRRCRTMVVEGPCSRFADVFAELKRS
jgi:hypothetical protein